MKNIHVLPTDKPSRLQLNVNTKMLVLFNNIQSNNESAHLTTQNIYITSDEKIKEGDWVYDFITETVYQLFEKATKNEFKIILTTDLDLIKDGVQAIDDEFLEWFVQNPSCEEVEVDTRPKVSSHFEKGFVIDNPNYMKIIIPKEEQKKILIDMMKQDEELGLYDEPLRKQFSANIEGSKEFNEMCKEEPKERLKKILGTKHPKQEINLEDIFNDGKKANIKKFIDEINNPSQPNQALKDAAERLRGKELFKESNDRARKTLSEIKSLPKQERSYSEGEVIQLLQKALTHQDDGETGSLVTAQGKIRTANFFSWFEKFRKK